MKIALKVSIIVTASAALLAVGSTKDLGVVASSLTLFGTVLAAGWIVWLTTSAVEACCERARRNAPSWETAIRRRNMRTYIADAIYYAVFICITISAVGLLIAIALGT